MDDRDEHDEEEDNDEGVDRFKERVLISVLH
jgi:hypothetical protein